MKSEKNYGWVIWFVGLPGCGKSTYARAVYTLLTKKGISVKYLSIDERRRYYCHEPRYNEQERLEVYRKFAEDSAEIAGKGNNVIMDGTAHRISMREYMRSMIPYFAEIYVRCTLATAMKREQKRPEGRVMADIYNKAIKRKKSGRQEKGLGEVIGVDVEFEENPAAECVIDSEKEGVEEGRDKVVDFLNRQWKVNR